MNTLIKSPKNGNVVIRNNDLSTLPGISSWLDNILGHTFETELMPSFNKGISLPAVNIKETNNEFLLELAAPGMKKSDFNIEVDNKVLSISSEVSAKNETENDNYIRREFGYASFKRTFNLPETVDSLNVSANYNDGILTVNLPKREEAIPKPPKRIEIK
jgi:HSP20 family protein